MRSLGLWELFDGILISSDEGCCKPDPAFFRILFDRYGLNPAHCLMIGNERTSDLAGHTEEITAGATADALVYEVEDMKQAIVGHPELMKLEFTEDVMKMMTRIRKDWGLAYPEELN